MKVTVTSTPFTTLGVKLALLHFLPGYLFESLKKIKLFSYIVWSHSLKEIPKRTILALDQLPWNWNLLSYGQ
jgi:hypothetical protein